MATKKTYRKKVETLTHEDISRKNIPTAEYEAMLHEKDESSVRVAYERPNAGHLAEEKQTRSRNLDPHLVWRGKDEQDWSDLVVHAPPLHIQEKVHPKVLIDDLRRQTEQAQTETEDDKIQVKINGVDVFHPNTGEVRSNGAKGIACWFIDTDYNEESFFIRQAYFLGANDPYKSLKTTLEAEINQEAWDTLNSDISRPFDKPKNRRIAIKVINHLGDKVMKVYRV